MRLSSRVAALTMAVCGLAGVGGTYLVGGRVAFDGLLYDAALATRAAFAGGEESAGRSPVTVVALDSRSLGAPELVRYPRALFAPIWGQLIEALTSAGAKVIAFDLLLSYSANQFQRDFDRALIRLGVSRMGSEGWWSFGALLGISSTSTTRSFTSGNAPIAGTKWARLNPRPATATFRWR